MLETISLFEMAREIAGKGYNSTQVASKASPLNSPEFEPIAELPVGNFSKLPYPMDTILEDLTAVYMASVETKRKIIMAKKNPSVENNKKSNIVLDSMASDMDSIFKIIRKVGKNIDYLV